MSIPSAILFVLALLGVGGVFYLLIGALAKRRALVVIERALTTSFAEGVFEEALTEGLPEPARRFFRHAIAPQTPLAKSVQLALVARIKQDPGKPHLELTCSERLTPGQGFVWRASGRMAYAPFSVSDHYHRDQAAVDVAALGLVRLASERGLDVARSARGRLAMEALWCPAALLPMTGTRWEAVDDTRARAIQLIDGQELAIELTVDEVGRLTQVTSQRWGDVGRSDHRLLPYGFEVLEERSFGGFTVPTHLRGGWHFGSREYLVANASEFVVLHATFS